MNLYPSWIHRIPDMIEALAGLATERIDRQLAEQLFGLGRTATKQLLRHMGAELCGHALVISRSLLMARLREANDHPEWRWERQRRAVIRARVEALHPTSRRSVVRVDAGLQSQIDRLAIAGLPSTIQLTPGCLTIRCRGMEHLVEQLVLFAKALDTDYHALQLLVESTPPRKPVESEGATSQSQTHEL